LALARLDIVQRERDTENSQDTHVAYMMIDLPFKGYCGDTTRLISLVEGHRKWRDLVRVPDEIARCGVVGEN
jgi:hypothetical protein